MLVKDIIWKALVRLNIESEYDKSQIAEIADKRVNDLIFSLNTIVKEITTDYIPLRHIENLSVVDGRIEYSMFNKHVVGIRQITRKSQQITFKQQVESVKVFCIDGAVDCEYDYSIGDLTINSEFSLSRRISDELIVFGVMGDYCLTKGMLDTAITYDRRYRDALSLAMRDTSSRKIAARGWYD